MNGRHLQRHLAVATLALSLGSWAQAAFAGGAPSTASLPLMLAGAQSSALDAVIDVRRPETRGIAVLAVTPGGNADRMGMRVGDRLLSVNGRSLTDTLEPNAVMQAALAQGGAIRATVSRDGQVLELSDTAPVERSTPPPSGCGYVSNRGTLPHVSDRLYPVEIISIDGGGLPIDANRHRLPAGMHAITVAERIESIRFNPVELRMREQLLRREGARAAKTVVVEVKPGTRHLLGARFLDDGLDGDRIRRNAYWEPVVWKDIADDCR